MSNTRTSFEQCIVDNLANFGYGKKRTEEVLDIYNRKRRIYQDNGTPNAEAQAMNDTYLETAYQAQEKTKGRLKNMELAGDLRDRIEQGVTAKTSRLVLDGSLRTGKGVGIVRGVVSILQADPRFRGTNLESETNAAYRKYWALMDDAVEKIGKGTLGRQKGGAHLNNVVREMFGEASGDVDAATIAKAYGLTQKTMIDDFNRAGGSIRELDGYAMPQRQSAAKLVKAGKPEWINNHLEWLDWNRVRRPDGTLVPASERVDVLSDVYDTLRSGGDINIDDNAMRGTGSSIGNMMEKHRFLIYKDADSWFAMHGKYGEGSVFDVIQSHLEGMARNTAIVQLFGRNPEMWRQMARSMVMKRASVEGKIAETARSKGKAFNDADLVTKETAEGVLATKFDAMFDTAMHRNSPDPNSPLAAGFSTTSNLLTAAQLGSASMLAIPSDVLNTTMVRFVNGQSLTGVGSVLGSYLKAMVPGNYKNFENFMTRAGYVVDEAISGTYATERYTGLTSYGPSVSRRVSDITMRASLLSKHTAVLRGVNVKEMMGALHDLRDEAFDATGLDQIMRRYGITADDWNAVRALPAWSPAKGAEFFRPLDILSSGLKNKEELYRKFFSMIDTESRYMVPGSTLEGQTFLRGSARTDTLPGVIASSFAMYKNFPVSMVMMYGRLAMGAGTSRNRRLAFVAGLGLGMTLVGALGVQMRELAKGREPMPMGNLAFAGKAFLAGGALSIWGDFLFTGVNQYGGGLPETIAGPVFGLAGDVTNLALGDAFKWAEAFDKGKDFDSPFAGRAVEFAKRYTPGTSVWWARLALEREVWDRLQEWADPKATQKQRRRVAKQKRDFGNDYFSAPGERLLTGP